MPKFLNRIFNIKNEYNTDDKNEPRIIKTIPSRILSPVNMTSFLFA